MQIAEMLSRVPETRAPRNYSSERVSSTSRISQLPATARLAAVKRLRNLLPQVQRPRNFSIHGRNVTFMRRRTCRGTRDQSTRNGTDDATKRRRRRRCHPHGLTFAEPAGYLLDHRVARKLRVRSLLTGREKIWPRGHAPDRFWVVRRTYAQEDSRGSARWHGALVRPADPARPGSPRGVRRIPARTPRELQLRLTRAPDARCTIYTGIDPPRKSRRPRFSTATWTLDA